MRLLGRVLLGLWEAFGWMLLFALGMHVGQGYGYGHGARDLARLMIELRQVATETPEPWDRGDI